MRRPLAPFLLTSATCAAASCGVAQPTVGLQHVYTRTIDDDGRSSDDHRAAITLGVRPRPQVLSLLGSVGRAAPRRPSAALPGACDLGPLCAWERATVVLETARLGGIP